MIPKIAVVIISWNTSELTENCLKSLFADLDNIDYEVWAVDNNSSDDSVQMIKSKFPSVRLIENSENVGFARANNQALKKARAEYFLLLNSDTIVPRGLIKLLCDFLDKNSDAQACAPRQIDKNGNTINFPLELPSIKAEFFDCLTYHFYPISPILSSFRNKSKNKAQVSNSPARAELLSAACLMLRKEVIDNIGLLAEDYFLFSEENDYFTRMKDAGYASFYLPAAEIVHLVGKSRERMGNIDSEVNFYRSRLIYFNKISGKKYIIIRSIYLLFFYWSIGFAKLGMLLRGRDESEYYRTYSALLNLVRKKSN